MNKFIATPYILVLLWAGLILGGSLIVAPAKFQGPNLSLAVALQVGEAQFSWLHIAESILLGLLIISLAANWNIHIGINKLCFFIPIVLFLLQKFWLLPILHERTMQIITNGLSTSGSKVLIII